jgi:hypothetical protein
MLAQFSILAAKKQFTRGIKYIKGGHKRTARKYMAIEE